jgi:hypothetical protein
MSIRSRIPNNIPLRVKACYEGINPTKNMILNKGKTPSRALELVVWNGFMFLNL